MIRIGPVSIALLGALAVSVCLALLLPSAARAECLYFDVTSNWKLYQSNGSQVFFDLQQTDGSFQGVATFDIPGVESDHHGSANGVISGDSVKFTIRWDDGAVGDYTGTVKGLTDSNDRLGVARGISLEGSTVDETNGASRATWHAHLDYRCLKDDGIYPKVSLNFGLPPPTVALGRTAAPAGTPPSAPMTICERARDARARNSPEAAALEARCSPPVALGRAPADSNTPPGPPMTICERARDARDRDSPLAATLEAQCARASFSASALPNGTSAALRAGPSTGAPGGQSATCALAASARAKNSPSAASLEAQCRALGGQP